MRKGVGIMADGSIDENEMLRLDKLMQAGYAIARGDDVALATAWGLTWTELKKTMDERGIPSLEDLDEALQKMQQSVYNWATDYDMALHNAALDNPRFHQERIAFCDEYAERVLDKMDASEFRRCAAEACFESGNSAEGDERFRALLQDFPRDIVGWTRWADQYSLRYGGDGEKNNARAAQILQEALGIPEIRDRTSILERLVDVYEDSDGMVAERDQARKLYEAEKKLHDRLRSKQTPAVSAKIGRNDPCHCGSGKKYKKCCGA
jgi:hypothetical protein